jgi:hypothetical protein
MKQHASEPMTEVCHYKQEEQYESMYGNNKSNEGYPRYTAANHPFGLDYLGDEEMVESMTKETKKKEEESDDEEFQFDATNDSKVLSEKKTDSNVVVVKEEESKVASLADVAKVCKFCGKSPCLLDKVYTEMMYVGEGMADFMADNKEIRPALYCLVAKKLFGRLGYGVRKQIPHCIIAEIHDAFPAKKTSDYIGFKDSSEDDGVKDKAE